MKPNISCKLLGVHIDEDLAPVVQRADNSYPADKSLSSG